MKNYTPEELAQENGENGRKALVVVEGKVYDVTESKLWRNGVHMKRHKSGLDHTGALSAAPHGIDVFKKFPVVGIFDSCINHNKDVPESGIKAKIDQWLSDHPFFRRHPHPAAVHLPIGIVFALMVFELLGLIFQNSVFEMAAYFCLVLTTLTIIPSAMTGYFTWWINYNAAKSKILNKKRCISWLSLFVGSLAVLVRSIFVKNPLSFDELTMAIYGLSLFILCTLIFYIGILGGHLTFPYELPRKKSDA